MKLIEDTGKSCQTKVPLSISLVQELGQRFDAKIMPVKVDITPPPPANSKQPGVTKSLLYNGSKFQGHQKSKGNSYEVEVVLQVSELRSSAASSRAGFLSVVCETYTVSMQQTIMKYS